MEELNRVLKEMADKMQEDVRNKGRASLMGVLKERGIDIGSVYLTPERSGELMDAYVTMAVDMLMLCFALDKQFGGEEGDKKLLSTVTKGSTSIALKDVEALMRKLTTPPDGMADMDFFTPANSVPC